MVPLSPPPWHAGWEQAKNLLQLKPQLESCGFALALVTIGARRAAALRASPSTTCTREASG